MEGKDNIRIEIDPKCREPVVIIRTDHETEQVERLINAVENILEGNAPQIAVNSGNSVTFLDRSDIIRVYTENRKLTICAKTGTYGSRLSLRELEGILEEDSFVRISRFEIINLKNVTSFDMNVAGTIRVVFEDGSDTWVARRYVHTIQQRLKDGLKGGW